MTDRGEQAAQCGAAPVGPRGGWSIGPPTRWGMLLRYAFPGIWLAYLAQTGAALPDHNGDVGIAVGTAILIVFAALYLAGITVTQRSRRGLGWLIIAALVTLTAAEAVFAHQDAFVMFIYVAVLVIGVTEFDAQAGRRRILILALAAATTFVPPLVPAWHSSFQWGNGFIVLLVALAMVGFFGLIRSNRELAAARSEVARLAAENERSRIARDLHDLLGHSLTTITVKAGLARRLAEHGEHDRSADEIAAVEELSRGSLADVRAAVAGYRDVTLAGELATGREVLRAAGVDPDLPPAVDVVEPELRTLFGWVVREGITNVVRHARATRCTITLGPNWVEILDNGRGGTAGAGNGLTGLRERVLAAGGAVSAGGIAAPVGGGVLADPAGGWQLRVDVPARADGQRADPAAAGSSPQVAASPA